MYDGYTESAPDWDVLGLGCSAVDDMIYLHGHPAADSRMRVERSERRCGGLTATALVAAARLGSQCAYAGALGRDPQSAFVREALGAEGIDLSPSPYLDGARPIHSRILVDIDTGARTILYELAGQTGAADDLSPDIVSRARVLLLDQYGLTATIRCAQAARQMGIPIVSDLDTRDMPGFEELLGLSDHLILGEQFAMDLTGAPDAASAVRRLWNDERSLVAVTAGDRGCWWAVSEEVRHMPAYRITPVDTTGCGDVFHGAYASSLAARLPIAECLGIASAAAAMKASSPTGTIPDRESVSKFRATNS